MTAESSWLSRPALLWKESTETEAACGYWADLDCLKSRGNLNRKTVSGAQLNFWSYKDVFLSTGVIINELRRRLRLMFPDSNPKETLLAIPIVVAIPEGPGLPLAILAVHSLNVPFLHHSGLAYAVLVPVDPAEGKDRIRNILNATRPAIVLGLRPDLVRLQDIVASLETIPSDTTRELYKDTHLFQAKSPMVLDFARLVPAAMPLEDAAISRCLRPRTHLMQTLNRVAHLLAQPTTTTTMNNNHQDPTSRISHCAFTSGSTGVPKGAVSSIASLLQYLDNKNHSHGIHSQSTVLLASSVSFDPCFSDILATLQAGATLAMATRRDLSQNLASLLSDLQVSHVLCTPSLWGHQMSHAAVRPPSLRVVALGGEPIPPHLRQGWARRPNDDDACRLYATYGVTEATVYQTMGEVLLSQATGGGSGGHDVGKPFAGMHIRICAEEDQENLIHVRDDVVGEIVLYGCQLDEWSFYLNNPELSRRKFVQARDTSGSFRIFYRTGDRGYLEPNTGSLVMLGRIGGEEGMVKINGVRVELGEIEAALLDDYLDQEPNVRQLESRAVVVDAAVVLRKREAESSDTAAPVELHAYCVLSSQCFKEMNLAADHSGILCNSKSALELLQARCKDKVRAGCDPSAFIFVPRIPVTMTGKRHLPSLPQLRDCQLQRDVSEGTPLRDYGSLGCFLSEQLSSCLNLQACQRSMLTTSVTFSMLGGDSLAATRIARALYAHHFGLDDNRFLGGQHGAIDGPFSAIHLVRARSLGDYVDFLDRTCVSGDTRRQNAGGSSNEEEDGHVKASVSEEIPSAEDEPGSGSTLFEALMQATSLGQTCLAIGLLRAGADPNWGDHGGRLGKVSGRNRRKAVFRSSPLHLACLRGDPELVSELLRKRAKWTCPDASGIYPLQLAASGDHARQSSPQDEKRRLECVQLLLAAGVPLLMKDGNRQTVLHCAARAGNCQLIRHILPLWKVERRGRDAASRDKSVDWRDHWARTPVHWAILNGHLEALALLLNHGCSPDPPGPKKNPKRSSIAVESPMELCTRLYPTTSEGIGLQIRDLLQEARTKEASKV